MAGWLWFVAAAARGHGTWPGPYAGAAVVAMYGPFRRRVLGDAAVARVVGCTNARPLVPHGRGAGCFGFGYGIIALTVGIVIHAS